jgi:hypothetical protein
MGHGEPPPSLSGPLPAVLRQAAFHSNRPSSETAVNLPQSSSHPTANDLDECLDWCAASCAGRGYGTWSRRCSARRLCPRPMALPMQRFLARPPASAPVEVPQGLPFDRAACATAHRTLTLILEVLDRRRPLVQLSPVLAPPAFRYLGVVTDWLPSSAHRGDARVLSIRMCQPRADVAEVAAVCRLGGRVRALAARFERHHDAVDGGLRWRCAVIHLG